MLKNDAEYIQTTLNDITTDIKNLSCAIEKKSPKPIIQHLAKRLADDSKRLPGLN